tara:strand:- start:311 stop:1240 length:930 start_codon:yes stop_codon:yes gene_type:complete
MTTQDSIDLLDIALVGFAKRMGAPNKLAHGLVKARRSVVHVGDVMRRRRQGAALLENSNWGTFIDQASGYRTLNPNTFPMASAAVAASLRIFESKGGIEGLTRGKKPFFTNILDAHDVEEHPELLDLILSPEIVESVTGYFGTLPRLKCMGVFVSAANDSTESSQLFHVDNDDFRQIKCFINLVETGPGQGPFTFLPAQSTATALSALGHSWGFGRFSDEEVASVTNMSESIALTGGMGSGAFVDTSRCLHYGSRARQGYRLVLMFNFMPFPDLKMNKGMFDMPGMPLFRIPASRYECDPLRRTLLGVS